jgi:hypothetical protein
LGGLLGTYQYLLFNQNAPFTAVDVEVLSGSSNPELLLYTWNHDNRTYAMDNQELQDHRLGIYDWMQRCTNLMAYMLMNGAFCITLEMEDFRNHKYQRVADKMSSVNNPGKLTEYPQIMQSLFQVIAAIPAYPINQLDHIDAEEMKYSLNHPDPMFFGNWYSWVIELVIKMVRSVLGQLNPNHYFLSGKPVSLVNLIFSVHLPIFPW